MSSTTAHFGLTKAASNERYSLPVVNGNSDIIDTQMYNNQQSAAKVMVGATANADGESGRVPAPTSADRTKYLKGDGTWDTPSGGGGSSADELTLAEYDELTTAEKNDGTIRFIPEGHIGITSAVDMSNITTYKEIAMDVSTSSNETELTWQDISSAIGLTFYYTTKVDLTNWDYITYDLNTGSSYGATHSSNPVRDLAIGVRSTAPTGITLHNSMNYAAYNQYDDTKVNSNFDGELLNVSSLSGEYYIIITCAGWNATFDNISLAVGSDNPSQIKYMSKTYGNNPDDVTSLDFTQLTATQIADLKTALGIS